MEVAIIVFFVCIWITIFYVSYLHRPKKGDAKIERLSWDDPRLKQLMEILHQPPRYSSNPAFVDTPLTSEQTQRVDDYARMVIERDLDNNRFSIMGYISSELYNEVKVIKAYKALCQEFDAGNIDTIDFHLKASELLGKINIKDLYPDKI